MSRHNHLENGDHNDFQGYHQCCKDDSKQDFVPLEMVLGKGVSTHHVDYNRQKCGYKADKYRIEEVNAKMAFWVSIQGIWYHFDQAGYMQTGWIQVNGVWYYLQPSGAMVASDWVLYQDKWYYFNQDGAMATAPVHYKGTEYRFDESGACINP